jgi:hypothetical protein
LTFVPRPALTMPGSTQAAEQEHRPQVDRQHAIPRIPAELGHRPRGVGARRVDEHSHRTELAVRALRGAPELARIGEIARDRRRPVTVRRVRVGDARRVARAARDQRDAGARPRQDEGRALKPLLAPVTSATWAARVPRSRSSCLSSLERRGHRDTDRGCAPTEALETPTAARLLGGVRAFDPSAALVSALHDRQSADAHWVPTAHVKPDARSTD